MPAVDFVELALEESPVYEGAAAAAPYRISTDKLYLPGRAARINANPQHLDRSDELRGIQGAPARLIETYEPDGSLSVRAYAKLLTWLFELVGFQGTVTAGGPGVKDPTATTVTGVNALNSPVINVASTAGFSDSGAIVIGADTITYTGKTATSFTGAGAHAATAGGEAVNQNVPAGTQKWVYTKRDSIDAQTAQIIINFASEALSLKGNGYAISNLTLNALGEVAADLMGLVVKRGAVDAVTVPAYPSQSIPPFRRRELLLTWLAGSGRTADFSLAFANPLERVRSLGIATPTPYPDAMEHGDQYVAVTGSIPKRVLDADDYDALLAATTFSATARWKSTQNIGATSYKYSLWVEMPACQYVAGAPSEMGAKRRFGMDSLDFFAAFDEVSGYDVKVTLVNDVAAIKTFV